MIIGVASFSQASEDQPSEFQDAEDISVEDYEDVLEASEEDDSLEDFPELSHEDFQDDFPQDIDAAVEGGSEDLEVFKAILQEAFKTWNADVKACNADQACLAQVNNVLRPMVNEATDKGVLAVIEPCEDRVGTYEVETDDGWTIEAVLPC